MKFKDVKGLPPKEITKKATELKKDLFEMKIKNSLGQLNNPVQIREARKNVARLLTALNAKNQ